MIIVTSYDFLFFVSNNGNPSTTSNKLTGLLDFISAIYKKFPYLHYTQHFFGRRKVFERDRFLFIEENDGRQRQVKRSKEHLISTTPDRMRRK